MRAGENPFAYARDPREALQSLYSPEARYKYVNRKICPNLDIVTWQKRGMMRSCERSYVEVPLTVRCGSEVRALSVYPRQGWQEKLTEQAAEALGVERVHLAHDDEALPSTPFALRGRTLQVRLERPERSQDLTPLEHYEQRLAHVAARSLATELSALPLSEARRFTRSRQRMTEWARRALESSALHSNYVGGEQAWRAAALGEHHGESTRAHFDEEHGFEEESYAAMATHLAEHAALAMRAELKRVPYDATCSLSRHHVERALERYFSQEQTFSPLDHGCGCSKKKKKGAKDSYVDELCVGFTKKQRAKCAEKEAEKAEKEAEKKAEAAERAKIKAQEKALRAQRKAIGESSVDALYPTLEPLDTAKMPALEPLADEKMPALEPLADEKMPALEPLADEKMPALVPLQESVTEMPALVPLQESDDTQVVERQRVKTRSPNAVSSIENVRPALERFSDANPWKQYVALAPTDDVFTKQDRDRLASMTLAQLRDALKPYIGVEPEEGSSELSMLNGRSFTLNRERKLEGLPNPSILGRHRISENMVAFSHKNKIAK